MGGRTQVGRNALRARLDMVLLLRLLLRLQAAFVRRGAQGSIGADMAVIWSGWVVDQRAPDGAII